MVFGFLERYGKHLTAENGPRKSPHQRRVSTSYLEPIQARLARHDFDCTNTYDRHDQ